MVDRRKSHRGTARPAAARPRKAVAKRKQPGAMDQFLAALPFSEAMLRRIATWAFVVLGGAILLGVASWFGLPGMIGTAVAEGIGRAGFRVEQVEVTGIKRADKMTVYAVALDQQSRAMPLVDLDKVRERLLEYGWIEDARVSRRMPDTLVVNIVERKPVAVWQHNGQLMLIDGNGVLLEPVRADAMPRLPLVIGDGAYAQQPAYQKLLGAAPALKPLVKAATWIGNRRWDLLFTSGETLSLPEGEAASAAALMKFAELDGTDRLLGRGYVRFDMRDSSKMVIRMPGQTVKRAITGEATED